MHGKSLDEGNSPAATSGLSSRPVATGAAGECEIDHVVPLADGGLTVDSNGRPACRYHNRNRHNRNRHNRNRHNRNRPPP